MVRLGVYARATPPEFMVGCPLVIETVFVCADEGLWTVVNIKTCPKCKIRIERNGGCNHMYAGEVHALKFQICFRWAHLGALERGGTAAGTCTSLSFLHLSCNLTNSSPCSVS